MNLWKKAGSLFVFVTLLSSTALAVPTVAGVWRGNVRFNRATLKNLPNPRSNTLRLKQLEQIEKVEITLTLLDNHSYVLKTTGEKQPKTPIGGKWSSNGKTLSLQRMEGGKEHGLPQVYTIAPDFKHFNVVKQTGGMETTVSFVRQ